MGFVVLFLIGFAGGVLGGMGMGGGTALIPLLTLCGVGQAEAQAVNLLAFAPTAALALLVHVRGGLVRGKGLWPLVLPALACSVPGALLAARLPAAVLRGAFGAFLVGLALLRARRALFARTSGRSV